jgi:cytochrome c oxidase assembly protein subunit 15
MPASHVRALRIWLSVVAALIVAMVLVGGATRLTNSGLSITQWQPIMGVTPPLNEADWQKAFAAYQKIPQYTELNQGMSLKEFKTIFWWEWAHRFLGRFIGVAFLVPFVIFWAIGYIPRALLPRFIGLFVLGGLQGALGWYMVKSGLVDRTDVSQYRLAAHFGVALSILGYTLWLLFGLGHERAVKPTAESSRAPAIVAGGMLGLVFLQLLAGALVAGLDAGMGYNTWPLINGAFVPSGLYEACAARCSSGDAGRLDSASCCPHPAWISAPSWRGRRVCGCRLPFLDGDPQAADLYGVSGESQRLIEVGDDVGFVLEPD